MLFRRSSKAITLLIAAALLSPPLYANECARAGTEAMAAAPRRLTDAEITAVQKFFENREKLPKELREFINSPIFIRMARSEHTAKVADYISSQAPGHYVSIEQGWMRELSRGETGRTRMMPLKTSAGEFQAGYQMNDNQILVIAKGVGVKGQGGQELADGEAAKGLSMFFMKAVIGSLIAGHRLAMQNPGTKTVVVTSIASINGAIHDVLNGKLGFSFHDTIPSTAADLIINDFERAIAQGADPARLNIITPKDYFIEIVIPL